VQVAADGSRAQELVVTGAPQAVTGTARPQASGPESGPQASGLGPRNKERVSGAGWFTAIIDSPAGVGLAPGDGKILLNIVAPEGFELSEGAPLTVAVEVSRRSDLISVTPEFLRGESHGGQGEQIALHASSSHEADIDSELIITLRSVACDARDHAACWPVQNSFRIPLRLLAEGQPEVRFSLPLELPREERASPASPAAQARGPEHK
jgi:hypothetical protein